MTWEKRVRLIAWGCFILMWIPFSVMIGAAVTDVDEPPVPAIILFCVLCILFAFFLVVSFVLRSPEAVMIPEKRIPAKATIISVVDTGTLVNNRPLLKIELDVHLPSRSGYVTTVVDVIPFSLLPQLQPGNTISVLYTADTGEVTLPGI